MNIPVDVANIEDLALEALNYSIVAHKFDIDWCPAQMGGHGVIGDRGDHGNAGRDVVEDTLIARLSKHSHRC